MYSLNTGRKLPRPNKRRGEGWKYAAEGAKPFRVTLWLVPAARAEIERMALEKCERTMAGKPRTGVIVSELVCYALEALHEELR